MASQSPATSIQGTEEPDVRIDAKSFDFDNLWYVEWIDSRQIGSGWVLAENISFRPMVVHSVGFLIADLPLSIMLAPHYAVEPPQISGGLEIPKAAILSKRKVVLDQDHYSASSTSCETVLVKENITEMGKAILKKAYLK